MAVMFVDISDSTSLYQKLGDSAARNIVDACLTLITGVLARYDGRVVKTIGDEVMCVFPACMSLAASTARSQPGKTHITSSPIVFTTRPS